MFNITLLARRIPVYLTDRNPAMRAATLNIRLRYGRHPQLVRGPCEESGKSADKGHRPGPGRYPYSHADQVLLGDEALHEPARETVPELDGVGRVLGVAVQGKNAVVAVAELGEGCPVRHSSCDLRM